KSDWNNKIQLVKETYHSSLSINKFLAFLKNEVEKFIESTPHSQLTDKRVKELVTSLIDGRRQNTEIKLVGEESENYKKLERVTFIDLFAGAGGFSEGFLQAETENKFYDF